MGGEQRRLRNNIWVFHIRIGRLAVVTEDLVRFTTGNITCFYDFLSNTITSYVCRRLWSRYSG
jgi:hypothetical protein